MRNLTVATCVSLILAGCGGGGEAPSNPNTTSNPSTPATPTPPAVVKDPLRIVTGASYDAGDGGNNPRFVIADFNKDGNRDILLRYDPESAFSSTKTGTSPVRFFLGKTEGGFEQSTTIFPDGYAPILVNRMALADMNGDGGTDIVIAAAGQDPYINGAGAPSGHTGTYAQVLQYSPNGYKLGRIQNAPLNFGHHVSTGDINGDFLPDAVITSTMYIDAYFIMGDANGNYKADTSRFNNNVLTRKVLETFPDGSPKKWENKRWTSSAIFDANGDGRNDVVLFAGGGTRTSTVYLNDGSGNFSDDRKIELPTTEMGNGYIWQTTPTNGFRVGPIHLDSLIADVDGDGKLDIISLYTRDKEGPTNSETYRGAALQVLINKGKGEFVDESKRVDFYWYPGSNFSQYDSLEYVDVNHDNCKDILLHKAQVDTMTDAKPTRILINDCKGNFSEKAYPKVLPVGILTVISDGHYAVLVSQKDSATGKYTQRVDDVYYDWSLGKNLFP